MQRKSVDENMAEELLTERDGEVTLLRLNRPQKANALSASLVEHLIDAVVAARENDTRLLVFEGNGSTFSAGFDFGGIKDQSDAELAWRLIRIEMLLQAVYHAPFVTMALVHGRVFGAGADLVCACAQRVAVPDTTFRMPGLGFGVVLGTRRLAHRVGLDAARDILQRTRTFDAEEAQRLGFLDTVAGNDDWLELIRDANRATRTLSTKTREILFDMLALDTRDADLAALARSVTRPGLKQRMLDYLASIKS